MAAFLYYCILNGGTEFPGHISVVSVAKIAMCQCWHQCSECLWLFSSRSFDKQDRIISEPILSGLVVFAVPQVGGVEE